MRVKVISSKDSYNRIFGDKSQLAGGLNYLSRISFSHTQKMVSKPAWYTTRLRIGKLILPSKIEGVAKQNQIILVP